MLKKQKNLIPTPERGNIPARLARIVEIGDHPSGPGGKFGVKSLVQLYFSLPTRIIDAPESQFHGKQHMVRTAPLNLSSSDKATLVKDYIKVLDPSFDTSLEEMSLAPLLNKTIYLTIDNNETDTGTFTNIMNTMGVPEGMEVGALDTTPWHHDFDQPDEDVWVTKMNDKQREKIQSALNYEGSGTERMVMKLEAMSSGTQPTAQAAGSNEPVSSGASIDLSDDIPF